MAVEEERAPTIVIRHMGGTNPDSFEVVRLEDSKSAGEITIPSPYAQPVEGRPDSNLMAELQWYLESFLDYPYDPETEHAERVMAALRAWGENAFNVIFGSRAVGRMFDAATSEDYGRLRLRVAADEPGILSWPWEGLRDPELGFIGYNCQVERTVEGNVRDPPPLAETLPKEAVHILLVIARPFEHDVEYRSVGRPLIDLIETQHLPARVTVLRPPTFRALREHLLEHKGTYHIVHFDGHGSYLDSVLLENEEGAVSIGTRHSPHVYSPSGHLHFEPEEESETLPEGKLLRKTLVTAEQLGTALREGGVPTVVLNACRSGMLKEGAEDPFASVAASLLQAGVRNVVAMAYNLYVSAAQRFLPAFYGRLFKEGDVAAAVRAGRQELFAEKERVCARGTFALQDWLVPVLYQQDPFSFDFAVGATEPEKRVLTLGEEFDATLNPYGFIGRDSAVLQLERGLRRAPPAILIQGLGGVGKTTLARGFCRWLSETEGLGEGCQWIGFRGVCSAEYVINRMGEAVFGDQFSAASLEQKISMLTKELFERSFLLVWDNFEVVAGIEGTSIKPSLSVEDRQVLSRFLDGLRGGRSKVLITSRSTEDWLGPTRRYLLQLGGMQGEERWVFFAAVLRDLGRSVNRNDPDQVELMKLLGGHPLAMRVILPRLERQSARELITAIRTNAGAFAGGEASQEQLFAALRVPLDAMPRELQSLLTPLALHEAYADAKFLEFMTRRVKAAPGREEIDRFVAVLATAGLVRELGHGILELHPMLRGLLRGTWLPKVDKATYEAWTRTFVDVMAGLADASVAKNLHEQRTVFYLHGANFHFALQEAERLDMEKAVASLTQSLAIFAMDTHDLAEAKRLFEHLAKQSETREDERSQAVAYHRLGMIAEKQWELTTAELWCHKAIAIFEKLGDEHSAASTYHQLGIIAEEQRDFASAEQWYLKSLAIEERLGNEYGAASTYHQLGTIAQKKRDFAVAEQWYLKSLAIEERLGNVEGAASTYHQLGTNAEEQRDFAPAEQWYRKAITIKEKLGDQHGAASTYHQLGMIAYEQRDFVTAELWCHKAIAIFEKFRDEHSGANSYHQLGMIAQAQQDFVTAEQWYLKSLAIEEKHGDEHGAAGTCHQLGIIAEERGDLATAERLCRRALAILEKLGDEHGAAITYHQLGIIAQKQQDFASAEQWYRKAITIREKLGDENGAASTYGQYGTLAILQGKFEEAASWFIHSIKTFAANNSPLGETQGVNNFKILYEKAPSDLTSKLSVMWEQAGLGPLPGKEIANEKHD